MSQPWLAALERRVPALAERALQDYVRGSAHYGDVPRHLHEHMAHTARTLYRLVLRSIAIDDEPTDRDLTLFRERGWERGAEGLPAADLADAYFALERVLAEELLASAPAEDLARAVRRLLECTRRAMCVALDAHQQEFVNTRTSARADTSRLVRRLVGGESAEPSERPDDLRLAPAYGVLAMRFAADPGEGASDRLGRLLSARRRLARVHSELNRLDDTTLLADLDVNGGLVLIASSPHTEASALATARRVVSTLDHELGLTVRAGFAHAVDPGELAEGAARATRLCAVASHDGDVAVLSDNLLPYHLHGESAAAPELRALVSRLAAEPHVLETLRTYLGTDLNRRATAALLHVHPNTVDNRLQRVATLTGADPRTSRGLLTLGTALAMAGQEHP